MTPEGDDVRNIIYNHTSVATDSFILRYKF